MEIARDRQISEEIVSELQLLLEKANDSLKNFNKKKYPDCFQNLMNHHKALFVAIENGFVSEANDGQWLKDVAEEFTSLAQQKILMKKWKFQRENRLADFNMFMIAYFLPMIQKFQGKMSEPFVEILLECWNQKFDMKMKVGTYDQILNGFRTGIFGINFNGSK